VELEKADKKRKEKIMAISITDILALVKELISDGDKMSKFKEIITDLKELIKDIKDLIGK